MTVDNGTYDTSTRTWTPAEGASVTKVIFTATKTTNFNGGTVTYEPKDTYTAAEWVRFDGSDRSNAMTTDYIPVTATKIGLGVIAEGGDGWQAIFSGRNTYAGTGISLYKNGNNSNFGYFTGSTAGDGDAFAALTLNQKYDIKADVTNLSLSTDGGTTWTDKATGNSETNATTRCLSIFGNPEWDNAFKGTIYYLNLSEGDTEVAKYTPVVRTSDGRIGYIDTVNDKFLTSLKSNSGYTFGPADGKYYMTGVTESLDIPESTTKQIEVSAIGTPATLVYKSSDESIATVDENGLVKGIGIGTCTIYSIATDADGNRWAMTTAVEVLGAVKTTYSPVDYIYYDGPKETYTHYFETGYLPKYNTVIDVTCKGYDRSKGSWSAIFSGRDNTSNGMSLYQNSNGVNFGYFVSGNNNDNAATYASNTDYTLTFSKDSLVVNGETVNKKTGITADNFKSGSHTISFFSGSQDWPFYGQISSFKISEMGADNTLTTIHEYQPVVRHDGTPAFLDKTTGEYIMASKSDGFYVGLNDATECKNISLAASQTVFKGFDCKVEPVFTNLDASKYTITYSTKHGLFTVGTDGSFTPASVGADTIVVKFADSEAGDVWELTQAVSVESATIAADNFETNDLTNGIILGSIKRSGDDYKAAYTVTFDSGKGYDSNYFCHVWGVPSVDESNNPWYAADYAMTNTSEAVWSYNNTVLPNSWPSNMGEVYVRRYFKTSGDITGSVYMPAPHDDAPCEYYINGTLVWSRTGQEPGVDGWYENEIVKLSDAQKALIKTDGSMNIFAYHVHQNWGGRYADGGLYCAGTDVANTFENNENSHRLASAVAQAETVEGFDADILAYAKNATVCLQDVNLALDKVRYELRKKLSPRHNYTMASAEPADGLECWLYNVGTGQFLGGSNDWGTHASVKYNISSWPMVLHANTSGDNRYSIQTNLPNGTRGTNDGLGHNGYVDCGTWNTTDAGWAWEFQADGNGNYRIINSGNSGTNIYLGVTEDARYQVDTDKSGADNDYNKWKIITRDMLESLADKATAENPADVSFYIHQNTFSQNDFDGNAKGSANADLNDSKWERNAGSIYNWKGNDVNGDYVYEMCNTAGTGKVYLKQTLEGLPAGQYYVECTGFYRDGTWDNAVAGNNRQLAYIYAGNEDTKTLLPNILDGAGKGAGYGRKDNWEYLIPDGCAAAPRFFQLGTYTVKTPVVCVGADGKLEIGVYRDAEDVLEKDWIVLDNFSLYRCGQAVGVGEDLIATYVAPVDVDFTGSGATAYAATFDGTYVQLSKDPVTTVPAGTAVVVKADAAGAYALAATTGATLGATNELKAATAAVTADGTQYILAKGTQGIGFYKATPETIIAKGKGYLVPDFGGDAKGYVLFGNGDEATAIQGVDASADANANAPMYNLSGQRISKAQKGVYIQNGKKTLK